MRTALHMIKDEFACASESLSKYLRDNRQETPENDDCGDAAEKRVHVALAASVKGL